MSEFRTSSIVLMPKHRNRLEHSRWDAGDVLAEILRIQNGTISFKGQFGPIHIQIKQRHRLFAERTQCVFCDTQIAVACLERTANNPDESWQLQFYGVKGKELVLFTVDHIVPRSNGGKDTAKNYQPSCQPCNTRKGAVCTDPFAAAKIRFRGTHE